MQLQPSVAAKKLAARERALGSTPSSVGMAEQALVSSDRRCSVNRAASISPGLRALPTGTVRPKERQ
jgi:hypothetical protein